MGAYPNVYLGPYLEVPITKRPRTRDIWKNSNGKTVKTKFNEHTGEEHTLKTIHEFVTSTPHPYIEDVEGLDEDAFWTPAYITTPKDVTIFLPNRHELGGENLDMNMGFTKILEHVDKDKIILEFSRKARKYINYYTEQFGRVEIRYGLIGYHH